MTRPASRLIPVALAGLALLLGACGGDEGAETSSPDQSLEHVHGLGVNPADGALYIATHFGLFRSPEGSDTAERVGDGTQDTMGFTVMGPDHFLGSGHPAAGEEGPPNLGLIESTDGAETWDEVSLGGEVDFHALVAAHDRVYGYDVTDGRLMVSDDGGQSWEERGPPPGVIAIAVDPTDPERIVASTEGGLAVSDDDGRSWQPLGPGGQIGVLAWPAKEALYLVDGRGGVHVSSDGGEGWKGVGEIGGQPAALVAESERELYAALPDGTVLESTDAGASWKIRSEP